MSDDETRILPSLADWRQKAERATSAETLLGLEGMAAKTYFAGFFSLLNGRHDFDVNDRNRRPPKDPVNAVLSFVYSLLVKELTVILQAVGFDPMLGFFHRPRYGRPSLALDVAEEYRPLIGDSVALMAFNNGELDHASFLERAGAVTLTESGRKAVIASFERRLEQEVTHPTFGYRVSYRRIMEVQARLLARTVTGELPEYVPFCTR
jgi:CRISPR-associated protein Cas1